MSELEYEMYGEAKDRILVVSKGIANSWKFYQVVAGKRVVVKLRCLGGKCLAQVSDKVLAFKKPHPSTFHREMMRQNARAHWLGMQFKADNVMANMIEFEQII